MYVFRNGQWNDHNRIKIVKREPKLFGIDDEDAGIRDEKGQKIVVLKMM